MFAGRSAETIIICVPSQAATVSSDSAQRRRRKLVIINGYVDETESDAVFVMAGYVAPADMWAKFSDEWAAALEAKPRISALKTNDAMRSPPRGEFWG